MYPLGTSLGTSLGTLLGRNNYTFPPKGGRRYRVKSMLRGFAYAAPAALTPHFPRQ